ncbi:MAG: acyltransferase family protein [Burkholderiales bacterium]|nr:acyltransferase family protein [Burkholderiales bacterium]
MGTLKPVSGERWDWVDVAKGIGIILVVYGHVARGLFHAGIYQDQTSFDLIDKIIYSFHMPLFFFLSGIFCISSFEKRGMKLVFNKIDTVFYPYILWSLIQGSVEIAMSNFTNQHVSPESLLAILWQPRAQFWFLYTLFFVFLLNTGVLFMLKRLAPLKKTWPLILMAIAVILTICKPLMPALFLFQSIADYDIYFSFGTIFWFLNKGAIDIKALLPLALLFIVMQYAVFFTGAIILEQQLTVILLASIGILTVIGIAQRSRFFSVLGLYSMEIYLMHVIFGSGMRILVQKGLAVEALLPHLIMGTLAGVLLPILATRWIHNIRFEFLLRPPRLIRLGS